MDFDWAEFARELEQSGSFAEFGEIPNLDKSELEAYSENAGLLSWSQIQAIRQENERETKMAQILSFFERFPQNDYEAERRISYSFLQHVWRVENPSTEKWFGDSTQRFEQGKYFEELLVGEGKRENYPLLSVQEMEDCEQWAKRAMFSDIVREASQSWEWQSNVFGECEGYKTKIKRDFWNASKKIVLDTKTTKCVTQKAFEKKCIELGYFLQGFMYLQTSNANGYYIVGTCKTKLANFEVEMGAKEFEIGRAQFYERINILKKYELDKIFEI